MSFAVGVHTIKEWPDASDNRETDRTAERSQREPDDGNTAGTVEAAEHPGRRDIRTDQAGPGI